MDDLFAQRLSDLIAWSGVSQGQWAKHLQTSPSFLSDLSKGKKKPGWEILRKLGEQAGVRLDWLAWGEGSCVVASSRNPGEQSPPFLHAAILRTLTAARLQKAATEADHGGTAPWVPRLDPAPSDVD